MKKFLCIGSLALGMTLSATAQKFQSQEISHSYENVIAKDLGILEQTSSQAFSPLHIIGEKKLKNDVSVTELGSFVNAFWLRLTLPRLVVDNKSNTVLFLHSGDNENTAYTDLYYSYTNNKGSDWETYNRLYVSNDDDFKGANYYFPALINPDNSTDPTANYLSYFAQNPTEENGVWGGYSIGTIPFGEQVQTVDEQEVFFNPDTDYFSTPTTKTCHVGNKVFTVCGNFDNDGGLFKESLILYKGEFDPVTKKVTYERSLINVQAGLWRSDLGPSDINIKFDQAGQVGYIFTTGNTDDNLFSDCAVASYILKTTDGGETWTDVKAFEYGGENMLDALKGLVTEEYWDSIFGTGDDPIPFPGEANVRWENFFQTDGVVDAYGNLHLLMGLNHAITDETGEKIYTIFGENSIPLIHLYTQGDGLDLHSELVTKLNTLSKTYVGEANTVFDFVTDSHRPRIVPAVDNKHLLFVWSDSEATVTEEGQEMSNDRPSIFGRGYLVNADGSGKFVGQSEIGGDGLAKFTHKTTADEVCHFYTASDELLGAVPTTGNFIVDVPLMFGEFTNASNPSMAEAVTHKYISGVQYDFGKVGLEESASIKSIMSVSQNTPNPCSGSTEITVSLAEQADLSIEIVNVLGQHISRIDRGVQEAGQHTIKMDVRILDAGIYFYTVNAGGNTVAKKMIVK